MFPLIVLVFKVPLERFHSSQQKNYIKIKLTKTKANSHLKLKKKQII